MSDKYVVKVNKTPEVKISESTTLVKQIKVGTPISSVDRASYDATTLGGDSPGSFRDWRLLTNKPDNIVLTQVNDNPGDSGGIIVSGSILPDTDIAYNLGSPNKRFKELFLAGETIFLGGTVLADAGGGQLAVGPAPVEGQPVDSSLLVPLSKFDSNRTIDTINDWIRGDNFTFDSTETQPGLLDFFDSNYVLQRVAGVGLVEIDEGGGDADNVAEQIDTFDVGEIRTVKYVISITDGNLKNQSDEILLTHNGNEVFMLTYATVKTQDSDLVNYNALIDGTTCALTANVLISSLDIKAKRITVGT
jgi:hypothetical protein